MRKDEWKLFYKTFREFETTSQDAVTEIVHYFNAFGGGMGDTLGPFAASVAALRRPYQFAVRPQRTVVARLPIANRFVVSRWGVGVYTSEGWVDGKDLEECRLRLFWRRQQRARRRIERGARLMTRIATRLVCTINDAIACGYCRDGIDGFRARYGLGEETTAAALRATEDPRAIAVITAAARRVLRPRHNRVWPYSRVRLAHTGEN